MWCELQNKCNRIKIILSITTTRHKETETDSKTDRLNFKLCACHIIFVFHSEIKSITNLAYFKAITGFKSCSKAITILSFGCSLIIHLNQTYITELTFYIKTNS